MIQLPLALFAKSADFPFHIHYGFHDDECFMHGHTDFSELVIVLDGIAEHLVGDVSYPITKGEVFVINQDTVHGYRTAQNFKICNIMFRPQHIFRPADDIRQSAGFQALFVVAPHYLQSNQFHSRLSLALNDYAVVKNMLDDMLCEYEQQQEGWQTALEAMFTRLCIMLSRNYRNDRTEHHTDVLKLSAAIAYIEKHYTHPITTTDLAQISGYSQRQLTRLFHNTFTATPKQYITKLRIQKAQQMLKDTFISISEIAWACGFEDPNYFSRVFHHQTGITPAEFRKRTQTVSYTK